MRRLFLISLKEKYISKAEMQEIILFNKSFNKYKVISVNQIAKISFYVIKKT